MLDVPYEFIIILVKLLQRSFTLWVLSPTMFMWGPGVTIPLYVCTMVMSWSTQRRVRGQAKRSQHSAHGNTLETLQKILTVRQFTMEDKEVSTYTSRNLRRNALELRRDVFVTLARIWAISANWFSQSYLYFVAFGLVVRGDLTPTQGVMCGALAWMVTQEASGLNMLVTDKMINMLEPVHRLSALLAMQPRIESTGDSGLLKVGERKGGWESGQARWLRAFCGARGLAFGE